MSLTKITATVQHVAEVIASVIHVDVTIVDHNLNRIAATGRYNREIGKKVNKHSVFSFALKKGESFIIENPRKNITCRQCENKLSCREYAQVCCPIKIDNQTIGVIGLIAFEEEQKHSIVNNQTNLMDFLNRMADLIASKVLEEEQNEKIKLLARELEIVLDSVDRGIVAADAEGKILHYNKKASQLFRMNDKEALHKNILSLLEGANLQNSPITNMSIRNREFVYRKGNYRFRGIFNANPIIIGSKILGMVYTFTNISEIINAVNDIATGSIVTSFDNIIGESECLRSVKNEAAKAAKTTSTILIQGESGTGKELFARAIHFHSNRSKGPFIPINCAAIPEQLLESELFGYEEGAFTGSRRGGKAGKFELANKGTIFLDEIGDMPIHLQTKLLRVLQENVIEKIGGKEYIPIDVRVIAATNKNLEQKVLEGEFRKDLFYRLNVIPLAIPPLRERKEDIDILVKELLDKCNRKLGKRIEIIEPEVYDLFLHYHWPGNIRELENTIEYAVNMSSGEAIRVDDLPNRLKSAVSLSKKLNVEPIIPLRQLEREAIEQAIKYYRSTGKVMNKAAEALGISRATLYRKIKEYNITVS